LPAAIYSNELDTCIGGLDDPLKGTVSPELDADRPTESVKMVIAPDCQALCRYTDPPPQSAIPPPSSLIGPVEHLHTLKGQLHQFEFG
jgi:hypothetical protein